MSDETVPAEGEEAPEASETSVSRDFLHPGPDAAAEPYYGVMPIGDDGLGTGNIWTWGNRIMLFVDPAVADQTVTKLARSGSAVKYARRGVTEMHLKAVMSLVQDADIEIFVIIGMSEGQIEAIPLDEHLAELKAAGDGDGAGAPESA